jgi:hypothetical protein
MAQPTSCDGPSGSSEAGSLILRRKQWRRKLPRARRRRPRRSGNFFRSFKGCSMEHPIFFAASCCSPDIPVRVSPQGEMASTRADVPGGRVPRGAAARSQIQSRRRGGFTWRRKQRARRRRLQRSDSLPANPRLPTSRTLGVGSWHICCDSSPASHRPALVPAAAYPPAPDDPRHPFRSRPVRTPCSGRPDAAVVSA